MLWGFLAVVGSNVFTVVQPMLIGRAIDALKLALETKQIEAGGLLFYAGLIVGLSVIAGIFTFLTRQTIIVVSRHIEFDLRNDFLAHVQRLPISYFQNTPTGDLMAHATNDIGAVRNVVGPGLMYPADTLMTFSMVLVLMLMTDWYITLLALIPLPLVSFVVYKISRLINKKFEERQETFSRLTTRAQENLSGIRIVKAFVREEYEISLFRKLSTEYLSRNLVLARVQALLWPLMFLLVGLSLVLTLYVGGMRVITGSMTIGTLTALFAYLTMLIWPMIAFGWVMNLLQQGAASMKRLCAIFDTVPEIRDTEETDTTIHSIRGEIEFRDVSFKHKNAVAPALRNINLKITPGTTLAIVGHTGSGKSTLVNLIARLSEVTEGQLLIDGIDIKRIPLDVLRRNLGMVPQETFLFSETIRENIRYGNNEADETAILHAADVSQIAKDLADFPKGFETMIGERGITLSGGQKQRTAIARAILRQPTVMILDDALSAVDTYTEEEILKRLRKYMADGNGNGRSRTNILISHRVSTIKDADLIVVLDNGRIAERGSHEELVVSGGIYADLYERQLLEEELDHL